MREAAASLLVAAAVLSTATAFTIRKYDRMDGLQEAEKKFRLLGNTVNALCNVPYQTVSLTCHTALWNLCDAQKNDTLWAAKMFDSSTKIPEGILMGHVVHVGNFDECVGVEASGDSPGFDGQFCLVTFAEDFSIDGTEHYGSFIGHGIHLMNLLGQEPVQIAWCVPSSCTPEEIAKVARQLGRQVQMNASVNPDHCTTRKRPPLRDLDIAAICILAAFAILALASTGYDILTNHSDEQRTVLTTFSIYSNWKRLIAVSKNDNQIQCINGIRVLTTGWVVLGHFLLYYIIQGPSSNTNYIFSYYQDLKRMGMVNTHLAVDTFLVVSGFLICYLFLKRQEKNIDFHIFSFYLHRYLRLTPALAIMVLLTASLFTRAGSGPIWNAQQNFVRRSCQDNWWTTLLYINNYVRTDWFPHDLCVSQSWYLSLDTQLYFLSPLILLPFWINERIRKPILAFLFLAGLAITFAIVFGMGIKPIFGLSSSPEDGEKYFVHYSMPAYTRFTPWIIGIMLGYALHQSKKELFSSLNSVAVSLGWTAAATLMLGAIYFQYPFQQENYEYDRLEASFYLTFQKPAWAFGLAWVIYACERGCGGFVNSILSWNFFQPLSRLSYCIYLTHLAVINLVGGSAQDPMHLADITMVPMFLGIYLLSVAYAIPLSLMFEWPFARLEKTLAGKDNEEKLRPELLSVLTTPLPFRKPDGLNIYAEMRQVNDEAENPFQGREAEEKGAGDIEWKDGAVVEININEDSSPKVTHFRTDSNGSSRKRKRKSSQNRNLVQIEIGKIEDEALRRNIKILRGNEDGLGDECISDTYISRLTNTEEVNIDKEDSKLENSQELSEEVNIDKKDLKPESSQELTEEVNIAKEDLKPESSQELTEGVNIAKEDLKPESSQELTERVNIAKEDLKPESSQEESPQKLTEGVNIAKEDLKPESSQKLTEGVNIVKEDLKPESSQELTKGVIINKENSKPDSSQDVSKEGTAQKESSGGENTDLEKPAGDDVAFVENKQDGATSDSSDEDSKL